MAEVITDHLDLWTSALFTKSTAGRGSNGKLEAYGIKKLRELILELAVRGKLVPQDQNDEPASVLLKKIEKERGRLANEGKIKNPGKLIQAEDDEKPYELPNTWVWVPLGYVSSIQTGKLDANASTPDGEYPFFTCARDPLRIDRYAYEGECVLLAGNGNFDVNYYDGKFEAYQRTYIIEGIGRDMISGRYLYRFAQDYADRLREMSVGGVISYIKIGFLTDALFPLPPLAEQHRIVAKVDELMALCDQLEQQQTDSLAAHQTLVEALLGTLTRVESQQEFSAAWARIANHFDTLFTTEASIDQLKQTILQLAVMGKLVPQDPNDEPASELLKRVAADKARMVRDGKTRREKDFSAIADDEIPFDLSAGWEWARINDVGHDWGQKTPDADFTYIDVSAIDNSLGVISESSVLRASDAPSRARKIVKIGTVIYSTVRPYLKNICLIEEDYSPEPIASTAFAVLHPFQGMPGKYFALYFRSPLFVRYVETVQTGIAYPAINDKQFYGGLIPIPPLAEQHRIVAKVDELIALCDTLKAHLADAQTTQLHLADAIVEQAAC